MVSNWIVIMKKIYPGDQDGENLKEPKWITDFCESHARTYIKERCEELINAGRYRDTEAIQNEFDFWLSARLYPFAIQSCIH